MIHRGYLEIVGATQNPSLQFAAASTFLEYMAKEFNPNAVAAVLGTMRDRMIKKISGTLDIYREKKRASNQVALNLLPSLRNLVSQEASQKQRFRKASLIAIVGNTIEFDIPGHEVDFNKLKQLIESAEKELAVDDISEIYQEANKANKILFLADNAGEIAFDKLLIAELKSLSAKVIVVVKAGPILNDATLADADAVNMQEVADAIITTGADAVGLPLPEERSKEFIKAYKEADFIIAKGMAYAETLTEVGLKQPHALLLRTKCNPVAKHFGVSRDENVAKLYKPRG